VKSLSFGIRAALIAMVVLSAHTRATPIATLEAITICF